VTNVTHDSGSPDRGDLRSRRRTWRRALLDAVYDAADASVTEFVEVFDLATALGIPQHEARKLLGYFEERRWLHVDDHRSGLARLTAEGVDAAES
jgi:hypothetical protein